MIFVGILQTTFLVVMDKDIVNVLAHSDAETVKGLLENGEPIETSVLNDALLRACGRGNSRLNNVRLLLEHGADVHTSNDDALCIAIAGVQEPHLVRLLLEYGADASACDNFPLKTIGNTIRMFQIYNVRKFMALYEEYVALFMSYGADPTGIIPQNIIDKVTVDTKPATLIPCTQHNR